MSVQDQPRKPLPWSAAAANPRARRCSPRHPFRRANPCVPADVRHRHPGRCAPFRTAAWSCVRYRPVPAATRRHGRHGWRGSSRHTAPESAPPADPARPCAWPTRRSATGACLRRNRRPDASRTRTSHRVPTSGAGTRSETPDPCWHAGSSDARVRHPIQSAIAGCRPRLPHPRRRLHAGWQTRPAVLRARCSLPSGSAAIPRDAADRSRYARRRHRPAAPAQCARSRHRPPTGCHVVARAPATDGTPARRPASAGPRHSMRQWRHKRRPTAGWPWPPAAHPGYRHAPPRTG